MNRTILIGATLLIGCSSDDNVATSSSTSPNGTTYPNMFFAFAGSNGTTKLIDIAGSGGIAGTINISGSSGVAGSGDIAGYGGVAGSLGVAGSTSIAGSLGVAGSSGLNKDFPFYEAKEGYCAVFRGNRMTILEWTATSGWSIHALEYSCFSSGNPVHAFGAITKEDEVADGVWSNGTEICKKCFCESDGTWWQGVYVNE